MNYCKVCNLNLAVEYDLCYDCLVGEIECDEDIVDSSLIPDKLLDESLTKYSVNREDRVYRVNPQLSCTHCKPHRGENTSYSRKHTKRKPTQKVQSKNIKQGSEFKRRQHRDY